MIFFHITKKSSANSKNSLLKRREALGRLCIKEFVPLFSAINAIKEDLKKKPTRCSRKRYLGNIYKWQISEKRSQISKSSVSKSITPLTFRVWRISWHGREIMNDKSHIRVSESIVYYLQSSYVRLDNDETCQSWHIYNLKDFLSFRKSDTNVKWLDGPPTFLCRFFGHGFLWRI